MLNIILTADKVSNSLVYGPLFCAIVYTDHITFLLCSTVVLV